MPGKRDDPSGNNEYGGDDLKYSPFDCAMHLDIIDIKLFLLIICLVHCRLSFSSGTLLFPGFDLYDAAHDVGQKGKATADVSHHRSVEPYARPQQAYKGNHDSQDTHESC